LSNGNEIRSVKISVSKPHEIQDKWPGYSQKFISFQFTLRQIFSEVVRAGFLEEMSLKPGSKLLATYGRTLEMVGAPDI